MAGVFAGEQHGEGAHRDLADDGRVGSGGGGPGGAGFAHGGDIRGRDVGRVDLDGGRQAGLVDGDLHALGEFVVGREHHGDIRVGRDHRTRLVGDGIGDGVVHRAELGGLVDARILLLEFLPGLVAAIERGDAGDIDIARLEAVAIVLDRLFQRQTGEVAVGLFDLRDLVVLDIDVEGDDLDAGVDGAFCRFLHRFRQTVLDDDALDAERDGLVDHVGLKRGVLAAVEHLKLDAERLRLGFDAGEIGLEEVAGRQITHQRDLDVARLVERFRHVGGQSTGGEGHGAGEAERQRTECSACKVHVSLLHW